MCKQQDLATYSLRKIRRNKREETPHISWEYEYKKSNAMLDGTNKLDLTKDLFEVPRDTQNEIFSKQVKILRLKYKPRGNSWHWKMKSECPRREDRIGWEKESVLINSGLSLHYSLADLMRWILNHSPSILPPHAQIHVIDGSLTKFLHRIWDHCLLNGLILNIFSLLYSLLWLPVPSI